MNKVTLSGHIIVSEDEIGMIREALPAHIAATRSEDGCLIFNVQEDVSEMGKFEVYEEFSSKKAFEFHQERVRESAWGKVTKNVARFYKVVGLEK